MPWIRANGCDFHYETAGQGAPILFLHGESHSLELFPAQFAAFQQTHQCVAYDRRGHAKSQVAPYGYSVWNQAHDLKCILDALGLEKVTLVAVAMSTTIATTFALQYPDRVSALVLSSWYELDGFPVLEERRRAQHAMSFADLHMLMYEVMQRSGRSGLETYLYENHQRILPIFPQQDDAVVQTLVRMFACHQPEHYLQTGEFYTSIPHLTPRLREVRCPVLGICGEADPSPDNPAVLSGMSNFEQKWVPGARRFTMLERPDEFNHILRNFLGAM
jgi:pimeloyl-ACP methyl ester carboxylesterase